MSIDYQTGGLAKTATIKLTTAWQTLFTSSDSYRYTVHSWWVCDNTGGTATFDLAVTDGVTTVYRRGAASVTAGGEVTSGQVQIVLEKGWSLQAKASANSKLDLGATYTAYSPSG